MRTLLSLVLFATATALAAPVPKVAPDPTKDRNGFPLPAGATARLGFAGLRAHQTYGVYFSADGKTVSTANDRDIFSWDCSTGRPVPERAANLGPGNVFLAGDRVFALAPHSPALGQPFPRDAGGEIVVRNRATGAEVSRIPYDGHINFAPYYGPPRLPGAAVSPDGRHVALVSAAGKSVEVYNSDTGKRLHTQKLKAAHSAGSQISPDGKTLYVCDGEGPVRRCELVSGKALPDLNGTDRFTNFIEASPDGKWVVSRGQRAIDGPNGHPQGVAPDDFLTVHDAVANAVVGRLEVGARVGQFAFAGPGAVIVTSGEYRPPGPPTARMSRWDVEARKRVWEVPVDGQLRVSPDGRRIALAAGGVIDLYDAATGKRTSDAPGHGGAVAWVGFAPDGQTVTTAGSTEAVTWSLAGEPKAVATPPELARGHMQSILLGEQLAWPAYDADGKTAALVGWDRTKGGIGWRLPLNGPGPERVYSHDGKLVVGAWADDKAKKVTVAAFDGPAGKKLGEWDVPGVTIQGAYSLPPLALSGDGQTLFVGAANGVTGYDAVTGKPGVAVATGPLPVVALRAAHPLAVSPDGTRLAVAHADERRRLALDVFEVKSGKRLARHDLGSMYYPAVRFSNTGRRVAVWTTHGTTLVCDAESDAAPRKLDAGKARPLCAAFSPNDATLAVGYGDGTALLWDLTAK